MLVHFPPHADFKVIVLIVFARSAYCCSTYIHCGHSNTLNSLAEKLPNTAIPHLSPPVSLSPSLHFSSLLPPFTTSLCCFLWCCSSERRAPKDLTVPLRFDPNSPHSCCLGLIHRPCWLAVWMSRPHVSLCTQNLFPHQSWQKKNMSKLILAEEIFAITSVLFWIDSATDVCDNIAKITEATDARHNVHLMRTASLLNKLLVELFSPCPLSPSNMARSIILNHFNFLHE